MAHRVDGQHSEIYYVDDASYTVRAEIEQVFDITQNIYFIVFDSSIEGIGTGVGRVSANGGHIGKNGGTVLISTYHFQGRIERDERRKEGYKLGGDKLSAHELGHAFGLAHDFRSGGYIMSYGAGRNRANRNGPDQEQLSACNADCLAVDTYFNSNIPTEEGELPTIELLSPSSYPAGSKSINIEVKATDSDGIHQVILFVRSAGPLSAGGFPEVKAYHKLTGEKEVTVNFEYDGDIPGTSFTDLAMRYSRKIAIAAIDINGDVYRKSFTLSQEPTNQLDATIPMKILGDKHETKIHDNAYQTWNLPTGAKTRIGKGVVRYGDSAAVFSPNGQHLAVASSVGIWIYDTMNYQEHTLISSPSPIDSIAFSPDGSAIVGDFQNSSQVWDIATKEKIATFDGYAATVAFSPDGRTIASAHWKKIVLWDVETEQEIIKIESEDRITTISFSHDGTLIAGAGGWDGLIRLWDVSTGQKTHTLSHKGAVNSIAFSPTEDILVSGSNDTTVKLWDAVTGAELLTIDNRGRITAVAFSPDGKTFAWVSSFTINLWDVTTQSPIAVYEDTTRFYMPTVALSPDGKTFVTTDSRSDIVKVWDITTGNTIDLGHVRLTPISFSPDSTMLASGGSRGVKLWDVNTGDTISHIPFAPESRVRLISFLPDAETLAYRVSGENSTRLWDVTTQTQVGIIENEFVHCWDFSPDGQTLASASDRIIELLDVKTSQSIAKLEGHLQDVEFISYSPDGNTLVSTSTFEDDPVRLWDLTTKQSTAIFEGDSQYAAFSNDGTILALEIMNVGVIAYNLVTPEITIINEYYFLTFLPDSTMMILKDYRSDSGKSISVWEAKTSTLITTLETETFEGWGKQPIFSPDGKTLAMAGFYSTVLFDPKVLYDQLPPSAPASVKLTNAIQTELLPNYPNPFNPETWIPFRLAEDATVTLTIYDVDGRVVRGLDIGHQRAGIYETRNKAIYWDGRNDLGESVASGVYFYHLTAGNYSATKRMVILK